MLRKIHTCWGAKVIDFLKRAVSFFLTNKRLSIAEKYSDFECIYDAPECAIYYRNNHHSDRVIVSFTGVGHSLNGVDVQAPEFMKASQIGSILFVIDKTRSWGNALIYNKVVEIVTQKTSGKTVYCIGNSMGGFLAILFSKALDAKRVLAITPQWSIDRAIVPQEKRWKNYTKNIPEIIHKDLSESFDANIGYLVMFGDDQDEGIHTPFFKLAQECNLLKFKNTGHNLASYLKEQGVLYEIINTWFDSEDFSTTLRKRGIEFE
jgi:hypothetical protein